MKTYSRPHRSGRDLLRDATAHATQERDGRDQLVVDIAEIDAKQVYREAGYSSTLSYCMDELELSKKAALHRIHVARVAWRLPAVLAALTEGRLHLTAVSMLAAHLTEENVDELVEVAEVKTKVELRQLIAERFPRRDLFTATPAAPSEPLFVATGEERSGELEMESGSQRRLDGVEVSSMESGERRLDGVEVPAQPVQMPPERFPLKVGLRRETHQKLRYAQDLLGHQVPAGDVAEVLDRALDELIAKLEKRKFGATDNPRPRRGNGKPRGRYIPAAVRRAVADRDGRQCTFVGDTGHRCQTRRRLEFDHIVEVARGGQSTVSNLRLRCRAHNQYTAECTFGPELMERRREEAKRAAAERKQSIAKEKAEEVIPYLRKLGIRATEAMQAAALCETVPDASLEERVKLALGSLAPRPRSVGRALPHGKRVTIALQRPTSARHEDLRYESRASRPPARLP